MAWEVPGHTEGQHRWKERVRLPRRKFLLALLQIIARRCPVATTNKFETACNKRIPAQKTRTRTTSLPLKLKKTWKMLQLQSALKRFFTQIWDHFHRKEWAQFARVKHFSILLHIVAIVARCCNCSQRWNGCSDKPGTISIGKNVLNLPGNSLFSTCCILLQVLQDVAKASSMLQL